MKTPWIIAGAVLLVVGLVVIILAYPDWSRYSLLKETLGWLWPSELQQKLDGYTVILMLGAGVAALGVVLALYGAFAGREKEK